MQQLEGFEYATALYLNMRYHVIRLSPANQYMKMIVTEFVKFRYNCLPMGMCATGNKFQAKEEKLPGDMEGTKRYIDDIIVLIKY